MSSNHLNRFDTFDKSSQEKCLCGIGSVDITR